ncbi:MAG: DUF4097 family beta strand repeat protein [Acidimicrobiia bacterium]|nr:DUF4097 family beta strand repeat protein [Acidimicrobiia bacterium]
MTLSVEIGAGSIDITATTTDRTEVELVPARADDADAIALIEQTQITHRGDTVAVHVPSGRRSGFLRRTPEIVARISAPEGSKLEASVRSADVRCRGRLGDARVSSSSGDVSLGEVDGNLRSNAASGDLHVDVCGGDVWAQSASGDIRLGAVAGDAEVKTASGDVTIDAAGRSATIRTASGDVCVDGICAGRTSITGVSGDVRTSVVPGMAVWLDVNTLSGDVHSTLDPPTNEIPSEQTLELAIQTVSGDIAITTGARRADCPTRKDTP